ncbi:hypothetical protein C8T65DRAFT_666965 [Cerioporus squamosus]|nr:hypothetical protein C8T65DRAFT_666965 [Cerioporus squamosus]
MSRRRSVRRCAHAKVFLRLSYLGPIALEWLSGLQTRPASVFSVTTVRCSVCGSVVVAVLECYTRRRAARMIVVSRCRNL